eukprot:1019409-Lingulodinium_polyedra.AAC.1
MPILRVQGQEDEFAAYGTTANCGPMLNTDPDVYLAKRAPSESLDERGDGDLSGILPELDGSVPHDQHAGAAPPSVVN